MNREQQVAIILAGLLVCVLFFAFDTQSPHQRQHSEQRIKNGLTLDHKAIATDARESLGPALAQELVQLEFESERANPEEREKCLKELSAFWYRQEHYLLAGLYAEEIAVLSNTDTAWSIAGTTYLTRINDAEGIWTEPRFNKGVEALENAASLNPDEINHRINQALAYTSRPLVDQPMKGIQMLLRLNERHPEHTGVLYHLGVLGVQSGQYEKARERLIKAAILEPKNQRVVCLLSKVMFQLNDSEQQKWKKICDSLTE